jgi:hypothetical protein
MPGVLWSFRPPASPPPSSRRPASHGRQRAAGAGPGPAPDPPISCIFGPASRRRPSVLARRGADGHRHAGRSALAGPRPRPRARPSPGGVTGARSRRRARPARHPARAVPAHAAGPENADLAADPPARPARAAQPRQRRRARPAGRAAAKRRRARPAGRAGAPAPEPRPGPPPPCEPEAAPPPQGSRPGGRPEPAGRRRGSGWGTESGAAGRGPTFEDDARNQRPPPDSAIRAPRRLVEPARTRQQRSIGTAGAGPTGPAAPAVTMRGRLGVDPRGRLRLPGGLDGDQVSASNSDRSRPD